MARAADLNDRASDWAAPRVVYLQHPSDPIVWWSPSLLFKQPDWLKEPRGYDVLPGTRWYPIVSFLQLAADMAVSTGVPDGHGHYYGADFANAWAAVLQPPGWTTGDTERHRSLNRHRSLKRHRATPCLLRFVWQAIQARRRPRCDARHVWSRRFAMLLTVKPPGSNPSPTSNTGQRSTS